MVNEDNYLTLYLCLSVICVRSELVKNLIYKRKCKVSERILIDVMMRNLMIPSKAI